MSSNKPYKVIIAGGRDFCNESCYLPNSREWIYDKQEAFRNLTKLTWMIGKNKIEIVCGGAKGADTVGEEFAKGNGIDIKYFIPDWRPNGVYDKSAGHKRNREMGNYATHLIAFWDGSSRGTKGMIDYAYEKDLKVIVIPYEIPTSRIKVVNRHEQGGGEYIGRGTPLGNPYVMSYQMTRESSIDNYREWITRKIDSKDKPVVDELDRLYKIAKEKSLVLSCSCKPKPCHGDVIKEILEEKL